MNPKLKILNKDVIILLVLIVLIALVYSHSLADDFVGDEFNLGDPVIGPAYKRQGGIAAAFDQTNYFAVWHDYRHDDAEVYGARITPGGDILDETGLVISQDLHSQGNPDVAFDSVNYFIVFEAREFSFSDVSIRGIFIDPSGEISGTQSFEIDDGVNDQKNPVVAYGSDNYLVAWLDLRNYDPPEVPYDYDIYAALIDTAGQRVASYEIARDRIGSDKPDAAFGGGVYLIVWSDSDGNDMNIYGSRYDSTGTLLDEEPFAVCDTFADQEQPRIIYNGENFVVAWQDYRNGEESNDDIYAARVGADGQVLDPGGIAVCVSAGLQKLPALTHSGENTLIAWEDYRNDADTEADIYVSRLTAEGVVLDPGGVPSVDDLGDQKAPTLIGGGGDFLLLWESKGGDVEAVRVDSGLAPAADPFVVSKSRNFQFRPQLAFNGDNYLAVAKDYRHGGMGIYAWRIDSTGSLLDPDGIFVAAPDDSDTAVNVASDGEDFLVTWFEYSDEIRGARVSADGQLLDAEALTIAAFTAHGDSQHALAFGSQYYLVVWEDDRNFTSSYTDLYATRVGTDGQALDPDGIPVTTLEYSQTDPVVSFDGENFLVAWHNGSSTSPSGICGARVAESDGAVPDDQCIPIAAISYAQYMPSVAYGAGLYFVVYRFGYAIYGTFVETDGTVSDPWGMYIASTYEYAMQPFVTFDGQRFFVAWQDNPTGFSMDILGAFVDLEGNVSHHEGIPLSADGADEKSPALAAGAGGRLILAYSNYNDDPAQQAWSGAYRILDTTAAPTTTSTTTTTTTTTSTTTTTTTTTTAAATTMPADDDADDDVNDDADDDVNDDMNDDVDDDDDANDELNDDTTDDDLQADSNSSDDDDDSDGPCGN